MEYRQRCNATIAATMIVALAASANVQSVDLRGAGGLKDGSDCAGFSTKDAAEVMRVPVEQVSRNVHKVHGSLWVCSYGTGKSLPGISFSIAIAPDAARAAAEMETYRDHLSTAGNTAAYKDRLPTGAYSDILGGGAGDEAVWTDINASLTVRKGHITLQFTHPMAKFDQLRIAKMVMAKF